MLLLVFFLFLLVLRLVAMVNKGVRGIGARAVLGLSGRWTTVGQIVSAERVLLADTMNSQREDANQYLLVGKHGEGEDGSSALLTYRQRRPNRLGEVPNMTRS